MVSWALGKKAVSDTFKKSQVQIFEPNIISSPSQAFHRRKYIAASSVLSRWICHISYTPSSDAFSYNSISGRHGSPEDSKAFRMDLPPFEVSISHVTCNMRDNITICNKHLPLIVVSRALLLD